MKITIDPPQGWKYGFPKDFDPYLDPPLRQWLVEQGYPQELIEAAGSGFSVRTWGGVVTRDSFVPGLDSLC